MKLCPRCGRLFPSPDGSSLCSECDEKRKLEVRERFKGKRDYHREYERRKETEDPEMRSFYRSKQWRMTSRKYLQHAHYTCEECGRQGTDVHHVQPVQTPEGWARRFDFDNLKLLCVRCHNEAHGRTFRNGWSGSGSRKAEEAAGDADGPQDEGGEGREGGGGGRRTVSDYRESPGLFGKRR